MSRNTVLSVLYVGVLVAALLIVQFELGMVNPTFGTVNSFIIWLRVFFVPPILFFFGIILLFAFDRFHKIAGLLSIALSVYWVMHILQDSV